MPTQSYKVSVLGSEPNFDSLPIAKITDYPLEQRDYRPFAQSIFCVGPKRIYLRMWAFEVSPAVTSALRCVLYLYPEQPELALGIVTERGDGVAVNGVGLLENGEDKAVEPELSKRLVASIQSSAHNGEDLQGVYWGATLSVPLSMVEELGGKTCLQPGQSFPGNFFKTCEDRQFAHRGSCFPADFSRNPYLRESMGTFQAVSY